MGAAGTQDTARGRNARLGLALSGLALAMLGVAFAAVPLYRLFCQVTGYAGTTQVAEAAPAVIGERVIKVRFNADVAAGLPWRFRPEQREISLRVGEPGLIYYEAENRSNRPVVGTATFNVTPLKAGPYFNKVQCFCFDEQRLEPGETARLGVSFFVDPSIVEDINLAEVQTITLSYTFFEAAGARDDTSAAAGSLAQRSASDRSVSN